MEANGMSRSLICFQIPTCVLAGRGPVRQRGLCRCTLLKSHGSDDSPGRAFDDRPTKKQKNDQARARKEKADMGLADKAKIDKAKADNVAMGASAAVTGKPKSGTCTLFNSTSGLQLWEQIPVPSRRASAGLDGLEVYREVLGSKRCAVICGLCGFNMRCFPGGGSWVVAGVTGRAGRPAGFRNRGAVCDTQRGFGNSQRNGSHRVNGPTTILGGDPGA